MQTHFYVIALCFWLLSCNTGSETTEPDNSLLGTLEQAHRVESFHEKEVLAYDFELEFGGTNRFQGTIYQTPSMDKIRFVKADGVELLYDRGALYVSPDTAEYRNARFAALTYPYFAAAPYKLSDPGTTFTETGEQNYSGKPYPTGKLTFGEGIGDSPDDWYLVFQDPDSKRAAAMAYIVTAGGRSVEEAEKSPSMISYTGYEEVDDIPFSKKWNFTRYTEGNAPGEQRGSATLTNVRFVPLGDTFRVPDNARRLED